MTIVHLEKLTALLFILMLCMSRCNSVHDKTDLGSTDTAKLVQIVFDDRELNSEIVKSFGSQHLRLIDNPTNHFENKLTFGRRPVQVVTVQEDLYQIPLTHPKELYVSISEIKFKSRDSASVEIIFHAGNAIAIFDLKRVDSNWIIYRRQRGKF